MFKKKPKENEAASSTPAKADAVIELKYSKPKILVLDLEDEVTKRLQVAGWNANAGTFGRP